MRTALHRFREGMVSPEEQLRWSWLAFFIAMACWDDDTDRSMAHRRADQDADWDVYNRWIRWYDNPYDAQAT